MESSAFDKALSILEPQISELQRQINDLEKWLWIASGAVIVGVALEVYFVLRQYRQDRDDRITWIKGFMPPPERPALWLLVAEMLSIILVVVGVTGELAVGVSSSKRNAELRSFNDRRLGLVRQQSAEAAVGAADARKEAGLAEKAGGEYRARAAGLEKEAAVLRQDNLRLQAEIHPRTLTPDQQREMGQALREFGALRVHIVWKDPESYNLGVQLAYALHSGGIATTVEDPPSTGRRGWQCRPNGPDGQSEPIRPIPGADKSTGIEVTWSRLPNIKMGLPNPTMELGIALGATLKKYLREVRIVPFCGPDAEPFNDVWVTVLPKPFDLNPFVLTPGATNQK